MLKGFNYFPGDKPKIDREPNEISFEEFSVGEGVSTWNVKLGNKQIGYINVPDYSKIDFNPGDKIDPQVVSRIEEAFKNEFSFYKDLKFQISKK